MTGLGRRLRNAIPVVVVLAVALALMYPVALLFGLPLARQRMETLANWLRTTVTALPLAEIASSVNETAAAGAGEPGAVNGIPFAANASGALYNVELFEEHGREVPTTWGELVETAEYFEGEGIVPFYAMLADAWTAQSPLAPVSLLEAAMSAPVAEASASRNA